MIITNAVKSSVIKKFNLNIDIRKTFNYSLKKKLLSSTKQSFNVTGTRLVKTKFD